MTPLELVRDACGKPLTSEDGDPVPLELRAPLAASQIAEFEARLPCPLPPDVRELLSHCRGFSGGVADFVDFTGEDCQYEFEDAFPHGLPIAADGFGNFWVVDLLPSSQHWGPIYFACHDAPVILYQSPTIAHFLAELFKASLPPYKSLVDDVHEDRLFEVWRKNPGVLSQGECFRSDDPVLRAFAQQLDDRFQIVDLRNAQIGFGFSWGRYGPNTVVRRFGFEPLFAYQKPRSFFEKLLVGATRG